MTGFLRVIVLAALVLAAGFASAEIEDVQHFSEALQREQPLRVYIPEPREEDERFPALYVLHGKSGSYKDWTELADAAEVAARYRMILVFPDGGAHATWIDSETMPEEKYETYLTRDLIRYIDENYPTIASREARGIMGLSLGGHGAFLMAAKHPDLYTSASALSGIMKISNHTEWPDVNERMGPWRENHDFWKANSVWEQADRFQDADVHLLFDSGRSDRLVGPYWEGIMLHEKLLELNAPHIWRLHPGTHTWEYWSHHLPEHLNFHQAVMMDAMEGQERWFTKYFSRMADFVKENELLTLDPADPPTLALLGSSTFEGFPAEMLPGHDLYNRGITSDHLGLYERGLSKRMELSIFDMKPDIAILNMGVNDIGDRYRSDAGEPTEEQMAQEYKNIVAEIRSRLPRTRLYLTTCTPVAGRFAHLNESIVSWNEFILGFAEEEGLPVADLYPSVDADGELGDVYTEDGLHLNRKGYELWSTLLLSAIAEKDADFHVYTLEKKDDEQ